MLCPAGVQANEQHGKLFIAAQQSDEGQQLLKQHVRTRHFHAHK